MEFHSKRAKNSRIPGTDRTICPNMHKSHAPGSTGQNLSSLFCALSGMKLLVLACSSAQSLRISSSLAHAGNTILCIPALIIFPLLDAPQDSVCLNCTISHQREMSRNYSSKISFFAKSTLSGILGTEIHFKNADMLSYAVHLLCCFKHLFCPHLSRILSCFRMEHLFVVHYRITGDKLHPRGYAYKLVLQNWTNALFPTCHSGNASTSIPHYNAKTVLAQKSCLT